MFITYRNRNLALPFRSRSEIFEPFHDQLFRNYLLFLTETFRFTPTFMEESGLLFPGQIFAVSMHWRDQLHIRTRKCDGSGEISMAEDVLYCEGQRRRLFGEFRCNEIQAANRFFRSDSVRFS